MRNTFLVGGPKTYIRERMRSPSMLADHQEAAPFLNHKTTIYENQQLPTTDDATTDIIIHIIRLIFNGTRRQFAPSYLIYVY